MSGNLITFYAKLVFKMKYAHLEVLCKKLFQMHYNKLTRVEVCAEPESKTVSCG